ncbi:MAG: cytochrome b N-terminal domain-containing protein [Anaerolineales bacterium]|jgi:quinol-cytochrome oxidoreductase complex cytochrome b subunit|nr:cytochrome b N-terminal domain-containing protein [Anaerolineales bacterium]
MNEGTKNPTILQRLRRLEPPAYPSDDRSRMRMVVDSLVLHLHPSKVPARTLKWSYTWGLGGLSGMLIVLLGLTGILLQMNYTPSPPQAYLDILALRSNTWFGDFLRNVHHWSANLLVVVSILHLLRVFFTGGFRHPRELNWLLGIGMLLLVLAANFTGYLLPWDQLAYWAITVGASIITYIPLIGETISRLLLGGPEVGAATLLNFYSLHISFIPLGIVILMSYHFWRVRKDGGLTIPKTLDEKEDPKMERVTTIPHLVRRELVFAMVWLGLIFAWSMFIPAPLEGIANPAVSPNPAKAPWYFLGIQELLLHFHPFVGAILIPGLALGALALLPFFDLEMDTVGIYFRSRRGRYLSLLAVGLAILLTPTWVVLDEYFIDWAAWLPGWPSLVSNGIIPLAFLLLSLVGLDEWLKSTFKAKREERILGLFIFLATGLVVLTIIGIFFRGAGMSLVWPWEITVH